MSLSGLCRYVCPSLVWLMFCRTVMCDVSSSSASSILGVNWSLPTATLMLSSAWLVDTAL
eukprot:scaffold2251_cov178-Amphora_coffeaeformis.AAC.5